MRWTKFTLWLLAAALLVLCACGAKTGEPSIGDLTRPPVEQTTPEPAEPKPEQEPATTKGKSKGDKTASGKVDADKLETPEPDGALLAAYEAILERSVEVLASGGDIEIKDGETGLLEACYGGTGVGYAVEDLTGDGVPELVLGSLIACSRNLAEASQWCKGLKGCDDMAKSVEKGKKQFVGPEIRGKVLGVIGLGAIGAKVANDALNLGMEVYGYDPYLSVDAAWNLSQHVHHCLNLGDMLPKCDYITIHVPYLPTTKGTINAQTLAACKEGVRVLNFARGELVDNAAMLAALENGHVAVYCTDFPTEELLGVPGVVCTPHLGASTPEAEDNCAVMAAAEISDYLKNGNIVHSVNMPEVSQPRSGGKRVCVIHRNEPGMISSITNITTEAGLNIENMVNKSKKEMAYTMLDVSGMNAATTAQIVEKLNAVPQVIRVRVL